MLAKGTSEKRKIGSSDRIVTLLTDFGLRDAYVGILKGVIIGISPSVKIVDLTHEIQPQDIRAASFCLAAAYPYFPRGTIHVAVVDPGVGTSRRAVALLLEDAVLVGPDNGVFTDILATKAVKKAVVLTRREFWLSENPGFTFHGRDIFAPVAAHLASGIPLSQLGEPIDSATLVRLNLSGWTETAGGFRGCVQHIDSFGNLVTNVPGHLVEGKPWKIQTGDRDIPGGKTYGDVPPGDLVALVGSHGFVEIAANGGNALFQLAMKLDDPMKVVIIEPEQ
ncbi:MAG: Adenosyl-chloride synthase [Syntrophus sp. PtaU1.Bin208]|nr:MAG: Adenosyl-chloride synthase [Syntrophus sp. PtaU1.Bin208]